MEFLMDTAAGTVLGILSGLGVGGGSLLLIYLTGLRRMDSGTARGISLLFFFPASALGCIRKKGDLSFKKLLPAIVSGMAAAAVFSYLSRILDPTLLKGAMGILLILAGIRELIPGKKKQGKK